MSPLTNSLLGVAFVLCGALATLLMYFLRGAVSRPQSGPEASTSGPPAEKADGVPIADQVAAEPGEAEYLAPWKRTADAREPYLDDIHAIAETGQSITEAMSSRKKPVSWDDVLIKGAQLAKMPLNEDEPIQTKTVLGPGADKPLVIDTPIIVSHMSYGALSREIKIALAKGSAAVGTAICSGEGGMLEDEFAHAHKYILEYVPNLYSITDENLRRVDAIEIKIGQSAKPGMGGHLPGNKVTEEIAVVRGREVGKEIISPAHFADIQTRDDLRRLVDSLRTRSEGRPIGVKIAAGDLEADLEFALAAGPDFFTLDGSAGATGAAPKFVKDATSVPTINALCRARKWLDQNHAEQVSLVITGGMRVSADFAKALALGADAVALATAALIASGCQQYRICNTGRCPVGIATQDPLLRRRLQIDTSARYLGNFLRVSTDELKMFARLTGNANVHEMSIEDVCTTNSELSSATMIAHV